LKILLKLLKFLRPFLWEICLSLLLGVAAIGASIGMLGTSAYLIASAALHPSIAELQVAIVGVRFFGISRAAFRYMERLVSHSVNLKGVAHLREWFYRQVESTPPAELYTQKAGDLLDRVMGNLETLENFYVRVVSPVVVAVVVTASVSLFVGGYGTQLGIILAIGLLVNGLVIPAFSLQLTRKTILKSAEIRAELSAQVIEWLQGLEVLQSNNAQERWMEKINQTGAESGKLQTKIAFLNGFDSGLILLFMNLTVFALLWAAIPRVGEGVFNGVSLAVILLVATASFEAVGNLPQAAVNLTASLEAARRLFAIGEDKKDPEKLYQLQSEGWQPERIEVKDLSFVYGEEQAFRLDQVSFTLEKGKKLALVGPSGSGKTSLVNLLLRFWSPAQGSISLDQIQAGDLDPYQMRTCFAVISQTTKLFSSSLRDNLLLANPQADEKRLRQVLKEVELEEWVKHLPRGLDTWLGDQGLRLSGGERQRVAIARSLLQDRPFIILDEPVENLDPSTAKKIMATIFNVIKDRGLFLITHDLSFLSRINEILVLENGSIIERGEYGALIDKGGEFARMVQFQAETLE
jgi:ATP-binding cassette subfamily C protein CydC